MTLLIYCELMVRKIFSSRRDKTHPIRGISPSKILPRCLEERMERQCISTLLLIMYVSWVPLLELMDMEGESKRGAFV